MNSFSQNSISFTKSISLGLKELKTLSLSKLRKVFSLMGKREKIALSLLFLIALLSFFFSLRNFYYSHTNPVPALGGVYSEGLLGQPTYINPLLANSEPDLSLTNLVFSSLYKYDQNGQLAPDLADGLAQISQDQKQYTVNLKKNAKWHNDKPVTADDVVFSISALKDPAYKSPLRSLWQTTTVEKLSDYSIKFTTRDISGSFLQNLTLPILPKSVWGNVDSQNFLLSKFNLEAVGSGPFAIKEIKKLPSGKIESISLNAFLGYYQGKPKIDQLIFKFYDNGDDLLNAFHSREILGFGFIPLGSNLFLEKTQTQAQILSVPLPQYQVVFFNLNNKILSNQDVRTALSLTTDKKQIIEQVFKNNALLPVSPFLLNSRLNPKALDSSLDIDKAKSLLDTAGWKVDSKTDQRTNSKGQIFEITIATNDTLVNSNAAELIAKQWQTALNIKVNLSILPAKQLADNVIKQRAFDVLLFPQKFGADPDPFLFWHSSQVKDPGFNLTGFSDQAVDKLITDARTTTNVQTRTEDYQTFSDLILAKSPVILLDQTEYIYAVDSGVKNIDLRTLYDPSQRFNNIWNWYIKESREWK